MTDDEFIKIGKQFDSLSIGAKQLYRALRAERARLAEATALINAAVALMTKEQVGQWPGVRAWLEGEGEE